MATRQPGANQNCGTYSIPPKSSLQLTPTKYSKRTLQFANIKGTPPEEQARMLLCTISASQSAVTDNPFEKTDIAFELTSHSLTTTIAAALDNDVKFSVANSIHTRTRVFA
jgi:uncharacterized membrane protein